MYNFNLILDSKVKPSGTLVLCGVSMNILLPSSAVSFLEWCISNNMEMSKEEIDFLSLDPTKEEVESFFSVKYGDFNSNIVRLLRYIVLDDLANKYEDGELLEQIEMVYSSFDYPEDMESFIYYMPNAKSSNNSELIKSFVLFMEEEKKFLSQGDLL